MTVPGSGFGQEEGTFHLRTTILPPEEKIGEFVQLFQVGCGWIGARPRVWWVARDSMRRVAGTVPWWHTMGLL